MLRIMSFVRDFRRLSRSQRHAFVASFLGWTLDSLDFFLLIFCVKAIATDFHGKPSDVLGAVFLTQAFRPVGAVVFGMLADRYRTPAGADFQHPQLLGDRAGLRLCAVAERAAGAARAVRHCDGRGVGRGRGAGVSRRCPRRGAETFSGILQEGYAFGSILASAAFALLFPLIGWRGLFMVGAQSGAAGALCADARGGVAGVAGGREQSRSKSESAAGGRIPAQLLAFLPTFLFLVLLMTAFMSFSHGTQDVYPTFLTVQMKLSPETVGLIGVLYGFGSIAGGYVFGALSEKWGTEASDRHRGTVVDPGDSAVCLRPFRAHAGHWRGADAVHGAGCVGGGAGLSN